MIYLMRFNVGPGVYFPPRRLNSMYSINKTSKSNNKYFTLDPLDFDFGFGIYYILSLEIDI